VQLPCFSQGQKNDFWKFECLNLAIHVVNFFEILMTYFQVSILQRSYGFMCQKKFFFQKFGSVLEMTILERFGENTIKELKGLILNY